MPLKKVQGIIFFFRQTEKFDYELPLGHFTDLNADNDKIIIIIHEFGGLFARADVKRSKRGIRASKTSTGYFRTFPTR